MGGGRGGVSFSVGTNSAQRLELGAAKTIPQNSAKIIYTKLVRRRQA